MYMTNALVPMLDHLVATYGTYARSLYLNCFLWIFPWEQAKFG